MNDTDRPETPAHEDFEEFLNLYSSTSGGVNDERQMKVIDKTVVNIVGQVGSLERGSEGSQDQELGGFTAAAGGRRITGRMCLRGIPQLLQCCSDKAKAGSDQFLRPLLAVVRKLDDPVSLSDLRDERRQQQAISRLIESLSDLLAFPNPQVNLAAASSLSKLVKDIREGGKDDLNPPPQLSQKRDTRFRCLSNTELLRKLQKAISTVSGQTSVLCLKTLRDVSSYVAVAQQLTEQGLPAVVSELLDQILMSEKCLDDDRIAIIIETMWNIVELYPPSRLIFGEEENLKTQYNMLRLFLTAGYKLREKELRNDALSVLTLIADEVATRETFFSVGLTELLWLASCGAELLADDETFTSRVKPFATTTNQDDFDMKKLSWHLLYLLSFSDVNMTFLREHNVMLVLISYVQKDCEIPNVVRWPLLQLLDLQVQVLNMLSFFCVAGAPELAAVNGPRILLEFLERCMDIQLRNATLRVLVRVASTENRVLVASEGAVSKIVELVMSAPELEVKCDCLQILAHTVDGDPELQKQFFDCNGITVIMSFLENSSEVIPPDEEQLVFSSIDAIWCCVVGRYESEMEFIEQEGVKALLDTLLIAPQWIAAPLLSCIEELLASNKAATIEFLDWRSESGKTAPQILISIWSSTGGYDRNSLEEPQNNAALTSTTASGISNISLSNVNININTLKDKVPYNHHNIRLKIFCLFHTAGLTTDSPELKVLTNEEAIQLQVILAFASIKRDEVWASIDNEFSTESQKPIGRDRRRLEIAKKNAATRWKDIENRQHKLRLADAERLDAEERNFHNLIMKKKTEGKVDNTKVKGLSITEAKIRKAQMLKASFMSAVPLDSTQTELTPRPPAAS
eukprot:TRINITY_DN14860_c0_g1_i1.p1 TRINITY_DN14860_c0_g1~~TRINITY_DN14860_c0_g1_i1.p1  ORF type:complete len:873 (+),score=173.60 TRINITY_DN14860_c0_g1_i1:47-2620(+)